MEYISLRIEQNTSKLINQFMKDFNYSTKTDFVREAIRDKLNQLKQKEAKEKAWDLLLASKGKLKNIGSDLSEKEFHKWRSNEGSKALVAYYNKKFGIKN